MASTFDTDFATDGWADLLDEFGESVTHRPLGNSSNDVAATAIFSEAEAARLDEAGYRTLRRGSLQVPSGTSVDVSDQWLIRSELWHTESLGVLFGGRRVLSVKRETEERRNAELRRRR